MILMNIGNFMVKLARYLQGTRNFRMVMPLCSGIRQYQIDSLHRIGNAAHFESQAAASCTKYFENLNTCIPKAMILTAPVLS